MLVAWVPETLVKWVTWGVDYGKGTYIQGGAGSSWVTKALLFLRPLLDRADPSLACPNFRITLMAYCHFCLPGPWQTWAMCPSWQLCGRCGGGVWEKMLGMVRECEILTWCWIHDCIGSCAVETYVGRHPLSEGSVLKCGSFGYIS